MNTMSVPRGSKRPCDDRDTSKKRRWDPASSKPVDLTCALEQQSYVQRLSADEQLYRHARIHRHIDVHERGPAQRSTRKQIKPHQHDVVPHTPAADNSSSPPAECSLARSRCAKKKPTKTRCAP